MSNKIDRRSFLKVLGIAGAACAMTALTGCDEEGTPSFPEEQTMQYSHTEVAGGIRGKAGRI